MAGEEAARMMALIDARWFGGGPPAAAAAAAEEEEEEKPRRRAAGKERRRREKSKSLSELQFEEVQGLRDLGFEISEQGADRRLVALVPGLRRLEEGGPAEGAVARPYLSEAWARSAVDDRRSLALRRRLRAWKLPPPHPGLDMKLHLRHWAHSVASSVR